jgi:hypothetical protein
MWFGIMLRAGAVIAMLVTVATRPSAARHPSAPDTAAAPAAPRPLRYVSVRRPPPLAACAELTDRAPAIDAIQIRRDGALISGGVDPYVSSARCTADGVTATASPALAGAPDSVAVALGGHEYAWTLAAGVTLRSGDEIVVTVLDGTNEPFQVFAGSDPINHELQLGTLTGTGSVRVP